MIEDYFNGKNSNLPQMNKNECNFGKWLASDKALIAYSKKEFDELHKMHDDLHEYAEGMLRKDTGSSQIKELKNLSSILLEKISTIIELEK